MRRDEPLLFCASCGAIIGRNEFPHEPGCPYAVEEVEIMIPAPEEVRVTDPTTGGQKGTKLARFSLIPPEFLWALAEHYGKGALKYDDRNWEKGYKWSLTADALERHWTQFKLGEDVDSETGSHHLLAVAWHAAALFIFWMRGLGTNDLQVKPKPTTGSWKQEGRQ